MIKIIIISTFLLFIYINGHAQNYTDHHFDYEFKEWENNQQYYNWKVYIVASTDYLNSIKEVDYYLDPSFRNPTRYITSAKGGDQFTLCANGWTGFTIRIRIIYKSNNKPDLYELFPLDLKDRSKRNPNFKCGF